MQLRLCCRDLVSLMVPCVRLAAMKTYSLSWHRLYFSPRRWKPSVFFLHLSQCFFSLCSLPHISPSFSINMDDLTGKWARLSLNTLETQTIPLAPEVENNNRVLVAKLFTKRRVNIEALSCTLKTMWWSIQNFEVRDLISNTILVTTQIHWTWI